MNLPPGPPTSRSADREVGGPGRRFRIRWWMWPIAILALLLACAVSLRLHGRAQFARVQADLHARGLATDPAELVALAPGVDRARQERLWLALQAIGGWSAWKGGVPVDHLQVAPEQAAVDSSLAAGAADVAAIERLLDQGPVVVSAFGWIERDPAVLRTIGIAQAAATRIPSLLAVRACANWWAAQATRAADPAPLLHRLDQWHEVLGRPGTLIDSMAAIVIAGIRDQTYLWLATRGRLPADALTRWSAEEPRHRRWCADGFASERCLFWEPGSRLSMSEAVPFSSLLSSLGSPSSIPTLLAWWPLQFHDLAHAVSALAAIEAALRDRPVPPVYAMPMHAQGLLTTIALPNLEESAITACEGAYLHRLRRIAAVIAARHRAGAPLPDDQTALAELLPPGTLDARDAHLPPVAYEHLSPSRFRIGLDPGGAQPAGMPAGRIATAIGKPAAAGATGDAQARWSLEIDLDAILVPPPPRAAGAKR